MPQQNEIDPEAQYTVRVRRAVKHGRTWLKPGAERIRLSGAAMLEIGLDALVDYEVVAPK